MADDNTPPNDNAAAELERRLAALEAKNAELLGEVKSERTKRREAEEARQAAEEEARAKAEEAAAKAGDVDTLRSSLEERHRKAVEAEKARADATEAQLRRLIIDGGIRDAMAKANVAQALAKGAALAFRDGRNIEIRDGQAFADGVPLAQAVTEWAGSDEGTVYQAAGHATGGGAPGGGKPQGRALADYTEAERLELARQGKLKPLLAQP